MSWKKVKLGDDAIEIIDGDRSANYPKSDELVNSGIPFLSTPNIQDNRINYAGVRFITYEKFAQLRKGKLSIGDLILTTRGSIGSVAIFNAIYKTAFINAQMLILRVDEVKIHNKFLYYLLISPHVQSLLKNYSSGSAQPQLPIKDLKEIELSYPSYNTQTKIASILSGYDDLIENNTRRVQILEQMAQTIYKEWFVNFRFPGHENTKFVDSQLGKIPEGWEVKNYKSICSKLTDGTHATPKPVEEGYNLVTGRNIKKGFIDFNDCYKISKDDHVEVMKRSKPEYGDIIFSNIGTLGNIHLVQEKFVYSIKNVALFKPLHKFYSNFLFIHLKSDTTLENLQQQALGTSQKFFSLEFLRDQTLVVPTESVLIEFDKTIEPLIKLRYSTYIKNQALRRTRDLLLPKLMSGEVEV